MTKIIQDWPPNVEVIGQHFPLTGNEIFAWGDTIYNPSGNPLPVWLIEHEKVHFSQQLDRVESWWDQYLIDPEFRLEQEIEAHRVEYKVFRQHNRDRNDRARYLMTIARRLASPMYGSIISVRDATRRIRL